MDSRVSKYKEDISNQSRVKRHSSLYQEINDKELENYSIRSNSTIIGNQNQDIDIEKLKKILDTKYNTNSPKRKSIKLEPVDTTESVIDDAPTKEYDLNVVLEQAREEKEESYEEARVKKLKDTQFDILKNLNLDLEKKEEDERHDAEKELEELINTIAINESKIKQETKDDEEESSADPLDLFSDLKGGDDTEVIDGLKEEIKKIEETSPVEVKTSKTSQIDNSFYTTSNIFKKKDFDDEEDDRISRWIKILIALIIIVFLIGLFIFLKATIGF